jgi:hypothetical protein
MLGRPMAVGDLTVAAGLRIRFIVIDCQGAGRYPEWEIGANAENCVNDLGVFGERAGKPLFAKSGFPEISGHSS